MTRKKPEELRSHRWFGVHDLRAFGHRSRIKQMGYGPEDYAGKPVIAIVNTWSDINQCHAHFKERVEDIKRGVFQAGGFPLELPAISLSEPFVKPTTMLYRNFLAMETEELLRSHPVDGAVLMGGCDKTTPGLIMGAISMNLPAIFVPAGAMLRGNYRGEVLGSGSDSWKYWAELQAGNITMQDWDEIEGGIARSAGMCMTMGTAATMTAIAEAMGFSLPGASSIPAPDAGHPRMCADSGRRVVEMVWDDLKPSDIMSAACVDNAIRCHLAMGGSTNAMIHVVAMARRAGIPLALQRFDELARRIPVLANVRPSGKYLMEDFFYAGGIRALLAELKDDLDLDCLTVNGRTLGENIAGAEVYHRRGDPDPLGPGLQGGGRDPLRQPRATGCGDQAVGGRSALPQAHRPGAGVRELRRDDGGDQRSGSGRHAGPCPGAQERRSGGRRYARMGHAAAAGEAAQAGRSRDDADLRRADERHLLRRLHPARVARGRGGRAVGPGPDRRHDRGRCRGAPASTSWSARTSCIAAAPNGGPSRYRRAATAACSCSTSARRTTAATSTSSLAPSRCPSPRFTEMPSCRLLGWTKEIG